MGDATKQYRVKPSYPKPAGGFLAIGPRYSGELIEDKVAVRFVHHGDRNWTEVVPIEHVEAAPDPARHSGGMTMLRCLPRAHTHDSDRVPRRLPRRWKGLVCGDERAPSSGGDERGRYDDEPIREATKGRNAWSWAELDRFAAAIRATNQPCTGSWRRARLEYGSAAARNEPGLDKLRALARLYGVRVGWLVDGEEPIREPWAEIGT